MNALLLVLAPFLPVALGISIVTARGRVAADLLLPFAALPALVLAALPEAERVTVLPDVLLGLDLGLSTGLDSGRRLFLAFTALLWIAAAVYGRGYLVRDRTRHRYNAFFLLTMGGSIGLILARDVAGYYLFFSLMTLASYLLVVFERSGPAYRAGRVYIVLALLGESLLLLGFLRATHLADSMLIDAVRSALAASPDAATLWLLFGGFATKAGVIPLHVWLPLAHPAAPTPASAVLSGAMIKAGLLGMLLFLPVGDASLPRFGLTIAALGFATAFYGVACGLPQSDAKGVLAYSSLSQMGLLVGSLGLVLAAPEVGRALVPAIVVYAAHHGLTKAALFFSVGVAGKAGARKDAAIALAALCALALAGAPLTGGALAKDFLKKGLSSGDTALAASLVVLLTLSAVATALLMLRFVFLVSRPVHEMKDAPDKSGQGAGLLMWGPFVATALLGQVLPWWLLAMAGYAPWQTASSTSALWHASWPPVAALLVAGGAVLVSKRVRPLKWPAVPLGDWINLLPAQAPGLAPLGKALERLAATSTSLFGRARRALRKLTAGVVRFEAGLVRSGGTAFAIGAAALGLVLALVL